MSDWLTYTAEDFVLFSAQTYFRLFELYYIALWPVGIVAGVLTIFLIALLWQGSTQAVRGCFAILALMWIWVALAFHLQHYATINWAAVYFGGAFAAQGLVLALLAWRGNVSPRPPTFLGRAGYAVMVIAIFVNPILDWATGRPFTQAGWFGMAPDPTAMATLGLLAIQQSPLRWALMVTPIVWCAVTGIVLSVLGSPTYAIPPIVALLSVWLAARSDLAKVKSQAGP